MPFFTEQLVSSACEEQGIALALSLSPFSIGFCYFECVLTDEIPKEWDISCQIMPTLHNARLLHEYFAHVPWDSCFQHCKNSFFLAFDIRSSNALAKTPNLYLSLKEGQEISCSWIKNMSLLLNNRSLDLDMENSLSTFLHKCKLSNFQAHNGCGFMLSRSDNCFKLIVDCGSINKTNDCLHLFGHAKHALAIIPFLEKILTIADFYFRLSIDIEKNPKKIAIECFPKNRITKENADKFLSFLIAEKMMSFEKKEGVLNWIGGSFFEENREDVKGMRSVIFLRKITHFKIIHTEGKPLQVKCYLSATNYAPTIH